MLFKKETTLRSKFDADKLFDKLEAAMVFDIKHPEKRKFRGKVDRANKTFSITQPIIGNERDSLRPEIKGFVRNDEGQDVRYIELKLRLDSGNKTLLIMGLVIFASLFCTSLLLIIFNPVDSVYYMWGIRASIIIPVFTFFGFLLTLSFFIMKSNEAIEELSFVFGAREI